MRALSLRQSLTGVWGLVILLFAFSCSQVEDLNPQLDAKEELAQGPGTKINFQGPLVEPVNWALRVGGNGNNGGNVDCDDLDETYAESSGRNNYNDGAFDEKWPEGLEVEVVDGTYVTWSYTAPKGYCLERMAVIVKGGSAANVYEYKSGIKNDDGLAAPVNASGKPAGLSNLTFCFTLTEAPEPPVSDGDQKECFEEGIVLRASAKVSGEGVTVVWYDAASGGNVVDDPILDEVGEVTYWAEAVKFEGCVSAERTAVKLVLEDCDEEYFCEGSQTAYGGSTEGDGSAWWFYFDTTKDAEQPIYAGQKLTNGKVTYDADKDEISIDLGDWELQESDEAVKVLAYNELPTARPANGGGPNSPRIYAGRELLVKGNGSRFYVIHLDVVCNQ
ncbi:immunoglobulin domain-containing protein [Fontibacter flavus]|uniref:Ig-like domain-containing protein n=1 Tax=Fontibacter flavus TaxID=654838 RepID=A0ABV6FNP0_9BACT